MTASADIYGSKVNGWTFDPAREVWWAKTGPSTWTEVRAAFDDPPRFRP